MASEELRFHIVAEDDATATLLRIAGATKAEVAAMTASTRASREAAGTSAKLQAARDKEADAVGRAAVAEQRLSEVRASGNAKASQVARAEQTLLKARRDAERAANAASREASKASSALSGEESGRGWLQGFTKWFGKGAGGVGKIMQDLGQVGGQGFLAGLRGVLSTPIVGPIVAGVLLGVVAVAATAAGAVLAGGIVAGFGAGLAGVGILFAAKTDAVKAAWHKALSDMADQMQSLTLPFQTALISMATVARRTFAGLAPELRDAFATMAPAVLDFGRKLGEGFTLLGQSFRPLASAFSALLGALGPGLRDMLGSISGGLRELSVSVQANPQPLGELVRGLGALTGDLLYDIKVLNDTDASFRRLTGGVGTVTVVIDVLRGVVGISIGLLTVLAGAAGRVLDAINALTHSSTANGDSMRAAATKTVGLVAALRQAHSTTTQTTPAVADLTAQINRQTSATNALLTAMHRLSGNALTLREAQINYATTVADATAAIAKNGRATSLNTKAGRDNQHQLDLVATAAQVLTDAQVRQSGATLTAAQTAQRARANFVQLAEKIGYSAAQAVALSKSLIDIPNVTRSVVIKYTTLGVNVTTPSAVGGSHQLIIPKGQHRASGGPVTAGTSYLVGEKGPEMFVPNVSGTIVSSKALQAQHKQAAAQAAAHYKALQRLDIFVNGPFAQGLLGSANHVGVVFNELMTKVLGLNLPKAKESRILEFLRVEDKKLVAAANHRAAIAKLLAAAQQKLADAVAASKQFAQQVTDSALSFTSITGAQAPADGSPLTAAGVIAQMTEKVRQTQNFARDLAQLRKRGLNLSTYKDIVGAGVEQGDTIAQALLAGNVNTFNTINRLQGNANSAAGGLGDTAANALYGGQIRAAQQNVYNINVTGALDSKAIAKQIQQILLDLKRRNGGVSLGIA